MLLGAPTKLFGRVACEQIGPTHIRQLQAAMKHDLRHQCITELLEGGAPEAAVLSIAGHVSRKMMEHYSHIRTEAKRKAVDALTSVAPAPNDLRVN